MQQFNIGLVLVAGSALLLSLFSKQLKRIGLSDSVLLLALGIVAGPAVLDLIAPSDWGDPMRVLEQVARLALAIGLMGVALRLPRNYLLEQWRPLLLVLAVGMTFMWLCSSAIVGAMLGLPLGLALLIGAAVTPTDPVVASAIVTGPVAEETLPSRLREIVSAESGANDGLAYLFVMIGIFVLSPPDRIGLELAKVIFWQILGAILLGAVIGWTAGWALRVVEARGLVEQPSVLMFTTALALATLGAVKLVGGTGILAVFVAGLAFDQQVNARERQTEERVVEGVDRFFITPIIILLGLMLPWQEWIALGWAAPALVIGMLLLRRLPLFLLLAGRTSALPERRDGAFAGWFGPVGVAAIYYAAMAHHQVDQPELWPVVSLLAAASIVAHGLTATPFSHLYARMRRSAR